MNATTARTLRLRRTPAALVSVGLAAVLAVSLSACGRSGVAAEGDGHTITVEQVQSATTTLKESSASQFGALTQGQILGALIIAPYAERAASASGKGVSDDAVRAALISQGSQSGFTAKSVAKLSEPALAALRGSLALSSLDNTAQAQVLDDLKAAHIKVSPRYGSFNPATAAIVPPAPNWLRPTATAAASATASATASSSPTTP